MKSRIIYIGIALFFFAILFYNCSSSPDHEKIQKQLRMEADAVNKNTPVMITEIIRFDSCSLHSNNDIEYFYSILDTVTPDQNFFKSIEIEAKKMTKEDPGMADIRSYKVSSVYNYRNTEGTMLYTFKITPSDY